MDLWVGEHVYSDSLITSAQKNKEVCAGPSNFSSIWNRSSNKWNGYESNLKIQTNEYWKHDPNKSYGG